MSDSRKLSLFNNLKWWQATILIVTILLAAGYALSQGVSLWRDGENRTGDLTSLTLPYSYIISTDGTKYWATNGTTGQVDFQSTNAWSVIQGAINGLPYTGGLIYFKEGEYLVDDTIVIDKPLTFQGEGPGGQYYGRAWLKLANNTNKDLIQVNIPGTYNNNFFPCIKDLGFDGNNANNNAGRGVYQINGYNLQITDNIFVYFRGPIIQITTESSHLIENNCLEFSSDYALTIYSPASTTASIRFIGNHVGGNKGCLNLTNWQPSALYWGILCTDNFLFKSTYPQLWIQNTNNQVFNNNIFCYPPTSLQNIYVKDSNQIDFKMNHIDMNGTGLSGICSTNSDYINIIGNTFSNILAGQRAYVDDDGSNIHGTKCDNPGFVTENSGSAKGCVNGTWIAHGLAGAPNGEVSLTISGNNFINSTCWFMEPTIIASNSTMFQISLLIDNSGTVTPVTPTNSVTIDWAVEYKP